MVHWKLEAVKTDSTPILLQHFFAATFFGKHFLTE